MDMKKKILSSSKQRELIGIIQIRFEKHMNRHKGFQWPRIQERLEACPEKIWSLHEMEKSGGEPDVVIFDKKSDEYIFCDCSIESPKGRRSMCYDRTARMSRKAHAPKKSALEMAQDMGTSLLTEEQYRALQKVEDFDLKTSSWISTPEEIRQLGGALFCDRRYNHVFTYHNSALSYYAARGFRCVLYI